MMKSINFENCQIATPNFSILSAITTLMKEKSKFQLWIFTP